MRPSLMPELLPRLDYIERMKRLFNASIVSYLPLNERYNTVAYDHSGNGRNGAATGVDWSSYGLGSYPAPYFDATNDYINWYSAGLASAFNPLELTIMCWCRVNAAAVWTDGVARQIIVLLATAGNQVTLLKSATNNTLQASYVAGATTDTVTTALTTTDWFHFALSVSDSGDTMMVYINGAQVGTTQTGIGNWAGALAATRCCIGAAITTPSNVWHGWLAHAILLNRAATAAEIREAARI